MSPASSVNIAAVKFVLYRQYSFWCGIALPQKDQPCLISLLSIYLNASAVTWPMHSVTVMVTGLVVIDA